MVDLGISQRQQERVPSTLAEADRLGWQIRGFPQVSKDGNTLVALLPPGERFENDAQAAEFARQNPQRVAMLWLIPDGATISLTAEERSDALAALTTQATFRELEAARAEERNVEEFAARLDEITARSPFNPERVLYEMFKERIFSGVSEERDEGLREAYQKALTDKMKGLFGESFSFESTLEQEQTFGQFIGSFLSSLSGGHYLEACSYGLPLITSLYTADRESMLAGMVIAAFEEFAGIPSEVIAEWHQAGKLTGALSEQQLWAMLNDPRVESFVGMYASLPRDYEDPSTEHRMMRFFSYPLRELVSDWPRLSGQEKGRLYAEIYDNWQAARSEPSVAYAMAMEFFRATGMDISSPAVRGASRQARLE
ncbi:MAG: hypothetical protein AB1657_04015 [Candidatus Micrarchaeota archaeon]